MTICTAAIASWPNLAANKLEPIVILAADRMITSRKKTEYELLDQTKIFWFNEKVAILCSGRLDDLRLVCQETSDLIAERNITRVPEMAQVFADCIQAYRRKQIEREHFNPLGLSIADFVSRQKEFTTEIRERLEDEISNPEADPGDVIIAGIDDKGAHLFTVEGPGIERSWGATGFAAIGIGAEHAEGEFISSMYTPFRNWLEAMVITFFAKKRAENAPGVGEHTDFWYITESGQVYLEPLSKTVRELDAMYNARRDAERMSVIDDAKQLDVILVQAGYGWKQKEAQQDATAATRTNGPDANQLEGIPGGTEEGQPPDSLRRT